MKTILRNVTIYSFLLFLLPLIIPGVSVVGGLQTILIGGAVLTVLFLILKPILNIISFPVNLVTLGIFNIFINALLLYLLTIFVTDISIGAFTYVRANFLGIIFPTMTFNTFFAYVYASAIYTAINSFIRWLMQ